MSLSIVKQRVLDAVRNHPSITTPELADLLGGSVSITRWAVYQCEELEFFDGNHIRFKKLAEEAQKTSPSVYIDKEGLH